MKKRLVMIFMTLGMLAGILTGCQMGSIEGTWTLTKLQTEDMSEPKEVDEVVDMLAEEYPEMDEEHRQEAHDMFAGIKITFNDDGTMSMYHTGYGKNANGTWTESDEKGVYIIHADSEAAEVTLDGGELTMEGTDGTSIYVFEKE